MIYLDNSATSRYKPWKEKWSMYRELSRQTNPGRSSHRDSIELAMKIEECRSLVEKELFHGKVIFTKNTTEALNLAIMGTETSGTVITTLYEHNSVLRPLKRLESMGKIKLKFIDHSSETELRRHLDSSVNLVVTTAMSNVTGKSFDVASIARTVKSISDAKILVDMAQAGAKELDLSDVDMCAYAGHKSLHGPLGTGFLAVKKDISLSPILYGGTGTSSLSLTQPTLIPDGLEAGTLNGLGIVGLYEGIKWTVRNREKIEKKINLITDGIYRGIKDIKNINIYAVNNGIILFNLNGVPPERTADTLNENYGIAVRSGLHCAPLAHKLIGTYPTGAVRISVGYNNSYGEIEKIVASINDCAKKL